jgi:CubicO group peptidase (beta-lactamase class C family)
MSDYSQAFAKIDRFVRECIAAFGTPGLTLAITDREKVIYTAAYGQENVERATPATIDTRFEIGSIGKAFTAIALLQQHEQGKLDLHAPVSRYLPWFNAGSDDQPITVHHLLTHTAGITEGSDQATDSRYEVWDLRNLYGLPPGEKFFYSNVGYKALGLVLEAVSGRPYGDVMTKNILEPLGMDATYPILTHAMRLQQASPYAPLYDDRPVGRHDPLVPAAWIESDTGDGCLSATAGDMAKFARLLLNRGQGPQGRLLSEESFDLLCDKMVEVAEDVHYGYGIQSIAVDGHLYIGRGGDMPGFLADLRADPDSGFGIAILLNGPGRPFAMAYYAHSVLRAAHEGRDLPEPPASNDPTNVDNASDYAGVYSDGTREITFVADDNHLLLDHNGTRATLDSRGEDAFYAAHPDFARFLFTFGRDEDERVVEVSWGGDWYRGTNYEGPTDFDVPAEWRAYAGHYRAHNPWVSNFRVVLRKGKLLMIGASGDETELVPRPEGAFQVGTEPAPERLRFDTIVEAQAWHARLSGGDYYRFFTP